jgi:hypothetical protein
MMPNRYILKGSDGAFEERSDLEAARAAVRDKLASGGWAYVEIYLDVGLPTGAARMKYECFDQKEGMWVRKDHEPTGPEDC